jgi:hypothetical protein
MAEATDFDHLIEECRAGPAESGGSSAGQSASRTADLLQVIDAIRAEGITSAAFR